MLVLRTEAPKRCRLLFQLAALVFLSSAPLLRAQSARVSIRGMKLDSQEMQDSLAMPFWRALAGVPCRREGLDTRNSSARELLSTTATLRARLSRDVGGLMQVAGTELSRQMVYRGPRYTIERVVIGDRVPGASSFAFLARPAVEGTRSAPVVLLHGSGTLPQEAFGWDLNGAYPLPTQFGGTSFRGSAIELVEAGYTVFVPWLEDDDQDSYWPRLQWEDLEGNGAMLRAKSNGVGAYFLLLNQVAGGIDFLSYLPDVDMSKLSVIGWSEGAQIAAVTAAFDSRISAVVRLAAPLDRAALRATVQGVFGEAVFTHVDCAFGDPEMAALIAPRPLLYAYSTKDQSVSRFDGFISSRVVATIRQIYSDLGQPRQFAVQADTDWTGANMRRVRTWLDSAIKFEPREVAATIVRPAPPEGERYRSQFIDSTRAQRRQYIARLGPCVSPSVSPNFESVAAFESSVEPLRRRLAAVLRIPRAPRNPSLRLVRRDTVLRQARYTLEYVELQSARTSLPLSGLLATPIANVGQSAPVVISVDGNYGLAGPFGLNGRENVPYLNAYADDLASNGTVVFAPFIPKDFPEIAAAELRARDPNGPTSWSYVVPLFSAAVDFVLSLPQVDSARVGIWGISYAAYPALFTAALDRRISTLLYSNPVTTADVLFSDPDGAGLAGWFGEICSVIDPTLTYLIAPRRMIRENGARDDNGYERYSLESVDKIRQVYDQLGLGYQFEFFRHTGGHETRPRTIFEQ